MWECASSPVNTVEWNYGQLVWIYRMEYGIMDNWYGLYRMEYGIMDNPYGYTEWGMQIWITGMDI